MVEVRGRPAELTRLGRFVDQVRDGPVALVVEGEPGIGKTALFDTTLSRLPEGVQVLVARCTQADSTLAFVGLGDLLGPPGEELYADLPPPQRRALDVVLHRAVADTDEIAPHVVGRATAEVLRVLAPVLVAVDDAQWLDPASARALTFALHRLRDVPVGLLLTRRTGREPATLALEDAVPAERRTRLAVGPLRDDDLVDLVEQHLDVRLSRGSRGWLTRTAAGNPLYALELAAEHCRADRPAPAPPALPARLEELVAGRLRRLPDIATEPLAAVACLAVPTVARVVAALGRPAAEGLDRAMDAGVIAVHEGRIGFAHPLYGLAAWARVAPSTRRSLHARLAGVVTEEEARADHLVRAADGPDEAVAAAAERAADLARARGAPEVAAELAEAAVRLTPADRPAERLRRLVAAGYHRVAAGDISSGRAHLAAAVEGRAPGPERAELTWRLAMVTTLDDDLASAVRMLEPALAECAGRPALTATVAIKLAGLRWWQGRLAESLEYGRLALREADRAGDPLTQLDVLLLHCRTALATNADDPSALRQRLILVQVAAGRRTPHDDGDVTLAGFEAASGDYVAAARRHERLYRRALDEGDDLGLAWLAGLLAELRLILGDISSARRLAEESTRHARRVDRPVAIGPALYATAIVHAYTGDLDAADADLSKLIAVADASGYVPAAVSARALAGFVQLSRGDSRAALAILEPLLDRIEALGFQEPTWCPAVWSIMDSLVDLGELDRAKAVADDLYNRGIAMDRPFALACAARARAMVSAATGDTSAALAEIDTALAAHDRFPWPFERARTLLAGGTILRRAKQRGAARDYLHRALAEFDRVDARAWAARATNELARIGGRSRTQALTPTERRVAALVASGHSNAEVAGALFISTRTVAAHLTHIYTKLGIRSRGELVRHLPALDEP